MPHALDTLASLLIAMAIIFGLVSTMLTVPMVAPRRQKAGVALSEAA
jgi:hypothetical protein